MLWATESGRHPLPCSPTRSLFSLSPFSISFSLCAFLSFFLCLCPYVIYVCPGVRVVRSITFFHFEAVTEHRTEPIALRTLGCCRVAYMTRSLEQLPCSAFARCAKNVCAVLPWRLEKNPLAIPPFGSLASIARGYEDGMDRLWSGWLGRGGLGWRTLFGMAWSHAMSRSPRARCSVFFLRPLNGFGNCVLICC